MTFPEAVQRVYEKIIEQFPDANKSMARNIADDEVFFLLLWGRFPRKVCQACKLVNHDLCFGSWCECDTCRSKEFR